MYPQRLHDKRFFKRRQNVFPKALQDNKEALYLGCGMSTQCFWNPGEEHVYLRSTNCIFESIDLFVDFTNEDNINVPVVERMSIEPLEHVQWYKAEKLEKLSGPNLKFVHKMCRKVNEVDFGLNRSEKVLQLFEKEYPLFYPSIQTLSYRGQDWEWNYRFDFTTSNIMQRKNGVIVFNDVVVVGLRRKLNEYIHNLPYEKLVEYTKARPYES